LGKAVRAAFETGLLEKGGGHAMAAGLTVRREKLGELRAFLEDRLSEACAASRDHLTLRIDGALTARSANLPFSELLEKAGPFGSGHSQPVFAFPSHRIKHARIVGRDHVSATLESPDGQSLRAIAFKASETALGNALLNERGEALHFAGTLSADYWQGSKRLQLRILDAAIPAK
jgi:single-stranded-DNA-specific exonuclease